MATLDLDVDSVDIDGYETDQSEVTMQLLSDTLAEDEREGVDIIAVGPVPFDFVVQLQRKHALNMHYTTTTVGPIPVLVRKSLSLDLKTRAILRNCSFELENCPRIVSRHVYLAPLGRWP